MKINPHTVQKVKNATSGELHTLKENYSTLVENMQVITTSGLIMICLVAVAAVVYFQNTILNFLALIIFAYPFYVFASREGHRDGYFEGYYDSLTSKGGIDMSGISHHLQHEGHYEAKNSMKSEAKHEDGRKSK